MRSVNRFTHMFTAGIAFRRALRPAFFASVLAITGVADAVASDLEVPAPIPANAARSYNSKYIPTARGIEEYASYYLRGGIGWNAMRLGSATATFQNSVTQLSTLGLGNMAIFSLGGGVYMSPRWRFDITLDYRRKADLTDDGTLGTTLAVDPSALQLASFLALANVYYDFRRGQRFNPYVGAGIGVVSHYIDGQEAGQLLTGRENTQFAAMLSAGVDVKLRDNWHLDLGYRYLFLGDAKYTYLASGAETAVDLKNIRAHEVRLDLRYDLF